jgi:hypothetical protein
MACTHVAQERVPYAVTSRNNRRGVLCEFVQRSLLRNYGKHISAAVNQQARIQEAVFSVDPPPKAI